jgi:hypothetical protein
LSVYSILYYKHNNAAEVLADRQTSYSFEDCKNAYQNVIIQMMMLGTKKAAMPLHISYVKESFGGIDESYYHVDFLNPKYEEPPQNYKPWGGTNPPDGHYNVNLNKYNKFFAIMGSNRNQLIDAPVIVDQSVIDTNITNEQIVAEILWEITFYGFSEKKTEKFLNNLKKRVNSAKKSVSKKKK